MKAILRYNNIRIAQYRGSDGSPAPAGGDMLKPVDAAAGGIVVVSPMTTSTPYCSKNGTKILLGGGIITMPDSGTPERFMQSNELPPFLSSEKNIRDGVLKDTDGGGSTG